MICRKEEDLPQRRGFATMKRIGHEEKDLTRTRGFVPKKTVGHKKEAAESDSQRGKTKQRFT